MRTEYDRPILLVEDNPMDVDLTQRAFARHKLLNPLQVANDGEEALNILDRWRGDEPLPVVILLDINLPKVSGLEVLRSYKSHPKIRTVPIIMLTSSAEDGDVQSAYQLGANSYIVKPVDFDEFLKVAEHIDLYWNVINLPPR
ncbi:MAG: response regulator [Chloroflexota bacterium]